ncbi:hypothetical protein COLO4_08927 [Corchorus olitorius]|uniref:Uncharacterized protein n=1 Tax=Corchorus olitorius TaxID=93759 RepID=A0A1R3KE11_9ROSI|nr:hypothetical protein COLO4_08927 [Corchorus olitorius]
MSCQVVGGRDKVNEKQGPAYSATVMQCEILSGIFPSYDSLVHG